LISIIRERQAKRIGNVLCNDTDIIEVEISRRRPSGKPCQKTLEWTTDKVNGKMCGHLKEKAQWREKWRQWCTEPAFRQRT